VTPSGLRVEHLDHPLGIHTSAPRFSWRLPAHTVRQKAYRIRTTNGWDTGQAGCERSLLIPYGGPVLRSAERITWQVKVWTDRGESDWSAPAWFEMGLLSAGDWTAPWIEPSAPLVRTTFAGRPTRLYVTARGVYEAFLNGERVGDAELTPGFTQYDSRLQVQTYDIGGLVRDGSNVLAIVLTEHEPVPARRGPGLPDGRAERLGRLGRRGGHRAVGALSPVRRRADPRRDVARDAGLDGPHRADGP
jgi:alpha-L-rhamnosidase